MIERVDMQIKSWEDSGVTIVTVTGRIDSLTAPELGNALRTYIDHGKVNLVLDLSQVDYASSATIHIVTAALREARAASGDLRLAGIQPTVRRLFSMSGLTMVAEFFADSQAAIDSFSRKGTA